MKLDQYRDWVVEHDNRWRYPNELTFQNLLHYHLALCEEAGEAGGQAKKLVRELETEGTLFTAAGQDAFLKRRHKVGIEMVDVMIYFQKILVQWNISADLFDQMWKDKFDILHGRWDSNLDRLPEVEGPCDFGCHAVEEVKDD